jgi:hypothetical protein
VATWADVSELGRRLPEVEEGTSYGRPALRVRRRLFAWMSPHADALVLRVDPGERPLLLETQPDVFGLIPHYADSPALVLVRLEAIGAGDLRERVAESWLLAAPPALARRHGDDPFA